MGEALRSVKWAEVVFTVANAPTQAKTNVMRVLDAVNRVGNEYFKRLSTATLNMVVRDELPRAPPARGTKIGKIYYVTQPAVAPPTFVFFVNDEKIYEGPKDYRLYLEGRLRNAAGFVGTPLKIHFRGKAQYKNRKVPGGDRPQPRYEAPHTYKPIEAEDDDFNF